MTPRHTARILPRMPFEPLTTRATRGATAGGLALALLAVLDTVETVAGRPDLGLASALFASLPIAVLTGLVLGTSLAVLGRGLERCSRVVGAFIAGLATFCANVALVALLAEKSPLPYLLLCAAAGAAAALLFAFGVSLRAARGWLLVTVGLHLADRHLLSWAYPNVHEALFFDAALLGTAALLAWLGSARPRAVLATLGALAAVALVVPASVSVLRAEPSVKVGVLGFSAVGGKLWRFVDAILDSDDDEAGWVVGGDCDDADAARHPNACERAGGPADANCNGVDHGVARLAFPASGPVPKRRPHVLFLSADALRADHATGPRLSAFRASAIDYPRAYTPVPFTAFALHSVATGRYPAFEPANESRWRLDRALVRAGYRLFAASDPTQGAPIDASGGLVDAVMRLPGETFDDVAATDRVADAAAAFLRALPPSPPVLLWAHLPDPHAPYLDDAGGTSGSDAERYRGEVARVDRAMGRILDALPEPERWIVVVFSDHGEELGEHGSRFHGSNIYEEQVRIPLAIRVPSDLGGGPAVVPAPVTLVQLAPTLLVLLGLEPGTFHVPPLPRAVPGGEPAQPVYLFVSTPTRLSGGMTYRLTGMVDDWTKTIHAPMAGLLETYDLSVDAGERVNLATSLPDALAAFEDTVCLSPRAPQ